MVIKQTLRRQALTHPALRAGSSLSRIAGEGAERSEAGEGSPAPRVGIAAHRVLRRAPGIK